MHKSDVLSICSLVVGVAALAGDAGFANALDSLFGNNAARITLAAIGLLGIVASQIMRALTNPSPPSGTVPVVAVQNGSQSTVAVAQPSSVTLTTPSAASQVAGK